CKAKVDLGFLIDGSSSIEEQGRGNFQKVITFVKQIVNKFEISQHDTHVGVVLFHRKADVVFGFHKYTNKSSIMRHISAIEYRGGGTKIGIALSVAQNGLYKTSSRNGIPKTLIVLTDGKSSDNVTGPAQMLRGSGVTIYAVGVGSKFEKDELKEIATDPDADHVFTSGFDDLVAIVQAIKNNICQAPPPTTSVVTSSTTSTVCKAKVDLGFLIDGSGSIEWQGRGNFQKVITFVKQIVNEFEISQHDTHVGVVLFDHTAKVVFGFHNYTDKNYIMRQISTINYPGGGTRTASALSIAHNDLYKTSSRNGISKTLIVLTDGDSIDNVKDPAQKLRDLGVTIYAVGIGSKINEDELKEMATDPDADHVFTSGFNNLGTIVQAIKDKVCQGEDTPPPTTSVLTSPTTPTASLACFGGILYKQYVLCAVFISTKLEVLDLHAVVFLSSSKPKILCEEPPDSLGVCKAKVDLGFLLDASASIEYSDKDNFQKCLDFIVQMVQAFDVGPSASHIGVVKFSSNANVEFSFNTFNDKQSIISKVNSIDYPGKFTYTGKALSLCKTGLFDAGKNAGM
ncbi:hypothetical protein QZH41_020681, partial [Actinostola sp. cb2023]